MGRALRLGPARGPSAAATCLIFKILLHLRSMYKIDRRGGGRGVQKSYTRKLTKDDILAILKGFDVVTKQILLLVPYQAKWNGSIHTVQLFNVYWTSLSPKLSLKVIFLFQSFLVITICVQEISTTKDRCETWNTFW